MLLNAMVSETQQGRVRIEQTRGRPILALLGELRGVARQVLATRRTVYTIALMIIVRIVGKVQSAFWSIIVTERIGIPARHIAFFPFARSFIMLGILIWVVPKLRGVRLDSRPAQPGEPCVAVRDERRSADARRRGGGFATR